MIRRIINKLKLWFFPPKEVVSIIGPGGHFKTLSEWEAARRGNLRDRNTIEIAEFEGDQR